MDGRGEVEGVAGDGGDLHRLPLRAVPGGRRTVIGTLEPRAVAVIDVRSVVELVHLDDVTGGERARIGYRNRGRILRNVRGDLDGASIGRPPAPEVDHRYRAWRQRRFEAGERGAGPAKHDPLLYLQIGRQPVGACREKNHLPLWTAVDRGLDCRCRVGAAVSVGRSVDGRAAGRPAGNAPRDTRIPGHPPVGRNDVPCRCGRTLDRGAAGARGASHGEEDQRGEDSKKNAAARMHVRKSLPGPYPTSRTAPTSRSRPTISTIL